MTASTLLASVGDNTPEMIDDNERRRQRRSVAVLLGQAVSVEAPRLDAVLLHHLKSVATQKSTTFIQLFKLPHSS